MILLLAGTGDARRVAVSLAERGVPLLASLAGATRQPETLPVPCRVGGFGGQAAFEAFLGEENITAVLDATHPFAHRITERTARVCAARGLPYLQLLRPPWRPGPGDRWVEIDREEDATRHIPEGAVVFLATGRQTLARFAGLAGRRLICRRIDPPEEPFPFAGGEYLVGRPPFSVADEVALFRRLAVDWLVVKNSGGAASATKLVAARELGLPVLMIRRPPRPAAPMVETVAAAVDWAVAQAGGAG